MIPAPAAVERNTKNVMEEFSAALPVHKGGRRLRNSVEDRM